MVKNILLALTFLCCSAWMVAQNPPDQSGGSTGSTSPQTSQPSSQSPSGTGQTTSPAAGDTNSNASGNMNGNETKIEGCLMNSGGNYTITDSSGVQYQLTGDTSKLSSHVNQQVQVKGSTSASGSAGTSASGSASNGSTASTQGTSNSTSSSTSQMFNVSKVKKISDSCSTSK
jgi:hypothetical protein